MTDEAPTPDEVDTMMSDIGSLVRVPFQVSRGLQTAKKLRAHIAALEAENKRLREAAEIGVAYVVAAQNGLTFTQPRMKADMAVFESALAQTGEKP